MRKIYAIGESLVDIIFSGWQPKFAKAGGSMLNTAVSLGRAGLPVSMITEFGNDNPGVFIDSFLKENGVDTSFVSRFAEGKTALALAYLNERNDARYTFYKNYPPERLNIELPVIVSNDTVLFGSIYSVTKEIRPYFIQLLKRGNGNGAIMVYDPNFRSSHASELPAFRPMIEENLKMATIVRGSDEDFRNIFGAESPDQAWDTVRKYCNCLIYTANASGVSVFTPSFKGRFEVMKIEPVSTIGAGDNFNAGVIASLYSMDASPSSIVNLGQAEWDKIIGTAIEFASEVCLSYDNYIGLPFASRYRSASRLQM